MTFISKCAAAIVITTSVLGTIQSARANVTAPGGFTQDAVSYIVTLKENLSDLQVAECSISMGLYGDDVKSIIPALIYTLVATVPQAEMISKLSCIEGIELNGQMGVMPIPPVAPGVETVSYIVTFRENLSFVKIKACEEGLRKNSDGLASIISGLIYSLKATSSQVEAISAQKSCVLAIEVESTMYPTPGIGVSN